MTDISDPSGNLIGQDAGASVNPNNPASGIPSLDSSGPASGLSAIGSSISGGISSAVSAIGSLFSGGSKTKLPIPNPLLDYASYDYVIGISCITDAQLQNPDKTYMAGQQTVIICKSANADPKNRVKTAFGSFDFFIDDLEIKSNIGLENNNNTNMLSMSFKIIEPYSMGMFLMALQQAAWDCKHDNYLTAPYLLTIEFRGMKENGSMVNIPNTKRYIPFMFRTSEMQVTESGATYQCDCYTSNSPALGDDHAKLKNDVSVKGKTVQEVLQTGEKSLQSVINKRLYDLKKDGRVAVPDEIVILFPTSIETASNPKSGSTTETKTSATTKVDVASLSSQLGIFRSTKNSSLIQDDAACNALGQAKIGFDDTRQGDTPIGKDNKVNPDGKQAIRANNFIDPKTGEFKFNQDTNIINAINQVLMVSDYAKRAMASNTVDDKGMRTWWRIETQLYRITTDENYKYTGDKPRLIVYRVVPYDAHTGHLNPPNTQPKGYTQLANTVVKQYNYIYTGKNVDVLKFNIDFKIGFAGVLGMAKLDETADAKRKAQASGAVDKEANQQPMPPGNNPQKTPGSLPTRVKNTGTSTSTDNKGGGGLETESSRAARQFHEAITNGSDMINLDMQIIGDPYWIAQSGQGNYSSKPDSANLNKDGSVNYQTGEVDIQVNFRTPIDINQSTGLYDFGTTKTAPVLQWSGLYQVINVTSSFHGGQFTQTLSGSRRPSQEVKRPTQEPYSADKTSPADNSDPTNPGANAVDANGNPVGNNGWGEG